VVVATGTSQRQSQKCLPRYCTDDERKWLAAGPKNPSESKRAFRKFGHLLEFTEQEWLDWLTDEGQATLERLQQRADAAEPVDEWREQVALFVSDRAGERVPTPFLRRGDVSFQEEVVDPGVLTVLTRDSWSDDSLAFPPPRRIGTMGDRTATLTRELEHFHPRGILGGDEQHAAGVHDGHTASAGIENPKPCDLTNRYYGWNNLGYA
jgi:hypothetical protein